MRILIYSYNYHPEPIGIAPLMTELAEGLVKRNHQVRVITGMPNYPERIIYPEYRGKLYINETINGVKIHRCYVWVRPQPGLIGRILLDGTFVFTSILQALNGWRPEVILLTVPPLPVGIPAALLGFLRRCPVVLNLQDILPEAAVHVGLLNNKLLIDIFATLEKFNYQTAAKISVIAEGFKDNLLNKGVPSEKLAVIPNWVDINFIKPLPKQKNSFRAVYGLKDKFVVLYSGNIGLTQGLETVIKAAAHLQHISEIIFIIVGEDKALKQLQQHCLNWDVNNVLFLPFQPREKLPEMLSAANIGLVVQKSNVISFNMPSKIQVLLASGCGIIASVPENGTAAQAVQQSGGGIVVPPENSEALAAAIFDLYNNPAQVEILGQKGREFAVEKYAFENILNQYETLFLDVSIAQ